MLAWRPSNTLDSQFCIEALETDQGAQFTSNACTTILKEAGFVINIDGKGCRFDHVVVEQLWRRVKYEEVYLKAYDSPREAATQLEP